MARISLYISFVLFAVNFTVELIHYRVEGQNDERLINCLAGCSAFAGDCGANFCPNNTEGVASDQTCSLGCDCFFFLCDGACYLDYGSGTVPTFGSRCNFSGNAVNLTALKLGNGSAFSGNAVNKTALLNLPGVAVNGADNQ